MQLYGNTHRRIRTLKAEFKGEKEVSGQNYSNAKVHAQSSRCRQKPRCLREMTPATPADVQRATHRESGLSEDAGYQARVSC